MEKYYQTGDVLYFETKEIPKTAKLIKGNLIHQGRDNHHLIEGSFELSEDNGIMYIECLRDCKLVHPEHTTIVLPLGKYFKRIVVEYDHFLEESKEVVD